MSYDVSYFPYALYDCKTKQIKAFNLSLFSLSKGHILESAAIIQHVKQCPLDSISWKFTAKNVKCESNIDKLLVRNGVTCISVPLCH